MKASACQGDSRLDALPHRAHRASGRRLLLGCLAASASLHAAVIAFFPGWVPNSAPPAVSRLEVVVLQPKLLPSVVPAAVPLHQGLERATPQRPRAAAAPQPQAERAAPEPVLLPPVRSPHASAAMDYIDQGPAVPNGRPQVESAPVAPPAYQAAYLRTPAPRYPEAARRSGEQGMVTLRVRVAVDGSASRVRVEKSSGSPDLDAAALEAVKAWRFTPARRGADPVESWMLVPIVFRLEGVL
jgi:protein TonB